MTILFGPILQFRGFSHQHWQTSALFAIPKDDVFPALSMTGELILLSQKILAQVPFNNPRYDLYRIDFALPERHNIGQFYLDDQLYTFYTPGVTEQPRIAYASCNGFSDPKMIKTVDCKNGRWIDLYAKHQINPYHILVMGGDQIYTDEMWKKITALDKWTNLPFAKRINTAFTQEMQKRLDELFCQLYFDRWEQTEIAQTLASIPTIMMWDDHDIFDGWGSYPTELHNSPVYQGIFKMAKRYFQVFQMQLADQERHPCQLTGQASYNLGYVGMGEIGILALDLRSERQPEPSQVISQATWDVIYQWLDKQSALKHLFVISSRHSAPLYPEFAYNLTYRFPSKLINW